MATTTKPTGASPTQYETLVGDVHDLRAFALAFDLRSLTGAARMTGESKATVSRRITRLEAALGTTLLRRSTRGVDRTDDGAAYRQRIGDVLALLAEANAMAVHQGQATPSGELRVSAPPGYANALAPHFAAFGAKYPEVVLVVQITSRFVDLEAERIDVALRATIARLADSSLVALRLGDEQPDAVLVASPGYVRAHPAPRRPQDLARHRFLALAESGAPFTLPLTRRGTAETIAVSLAAAVVGPDVGFLKEMALHGAGIAVLPRPNVERELEAGSLVHLLSGYTWPASSLFLLHRGGPFVPPRVQALATFLRSAMGRAPTRR